MSHSAAHNTYNFIVPASKTQEELARKEKEITPEPD